MVWWATMNLEISKTIDVCIFEGGEFRKISSSGNFFQSLYSRFVISGAARGHVSDTCIYFNL